MEEPELLVALSEKVFEKSLQLYAQQLLDGFGCLFQKKTKGSVMLIALLHKIIACNFGFFLGFDSHWS